MSSQSWHSEPLLIVFRSSNMLYPKEDAASNTLMFACRSCQYSEPAQAARIYRNALKEQVEETPGNVEDVAQDPTVGDSSPAHDYGGDTGYEGMDIDSEDEDEDGLPSTCTLCGNEIKCPYCGEASDGGVALEVDDPEKGVDGLQEEKLVQQEQRERAQSTAGHGGS